MERRFSKRELGKMLIGAGITAALGACKSDNILRPQETPTQEEALSTAIAQFNEAEKVNRAKYGEWEKEFERQRKETPALDICYDWPVSGAISSFYGPAHPLGIDIDFAQDNPFPDIKAPAEGKINYVGGDPCCSYGNYIVMEHPGNIFTLYAHLSEFAVKQGDEVSTRQLIAKGGSTGYSRGPHLHFEVASITNARFYRHNPLNYLKDGPNKDCTR